MTPPDLEIEAEGRIRVYGRTTAKPKNDRVVQNAKAKWRANEDRFRLSQKGDRIVCAVSDGAGSSGMYCGAWAETLVSKLPNKPLKNFKALNDWMEGFWQGFSEKYKMLSASETFKRNKFVREGSCATLTACWVKPIEGGARLYWMAYGDSPLMIFQDKANGPRMFFPDSLASFDHAPHLLNWKDLPDESQFHAGTVDLKGPAKVVLASDGMGQFLLLRHLSDMFRNMGERNGEAALMDEFARFVKRPQGRMANLVRSHLASPGPGILRELDAIRDNMEDDESFAAMAERCHAQKLLPNDDATLVIIEIEPPLPEPEPEPEPEEETASDDEETAVAEPEPQLELALEAPPEQEPQTEPEQEPEPAPEPEPEPQEPS